MLSGSYNAAYGPPANGYDPDFDIPQSYMQAAGINIAPPIEHTYMPATYFYAAPQPSPVNQPTRRTRASKPKVRTGCITCKIRRIKCGEEKPSCLKCTSTGRKCDGYEFERNKKSNVVTPVKPGTDSGIRPTVPAIFVSSAPKPWGHAFDGTVQERRMFHRFKLRTIPALAGGSELDFWNNYVVQVAVQEKVIRDAVIALGTLHEDFENRKGKYDQVVINEKTHRNATVLYGQAIRNLYNRIDKSPGETAKLAIIASILFTCFEVIRRNNMAAVIHYQAGMRELMRQIGTRQSKAQAQASITEKQPKVKILARPEDDLDRMMRVFARYDIQACTFVKPKAEPLDMHLRSAPPDTIMEMAELRYHIDNLLIEAYQLIKADMAMYRYWKAGLIPQELHARRAESLEKFQAWSKVIERHMEPTLIQNSGREIATIKSLLGLMLQIKVAIILLRVSIDSGPEISFDAFHDDFEDMVSRVERMTDALMLAEAEPLAAEDAPFTMELGVVHPLFFIAHRCRDWSLRRRALVQLRKAGKEGIWEGPIMAVVARRMMEIEEHGLEFGETIPERARIHYSRAEVQYDERVVRALFRLAQDESWRKWTDMPELIRF